MSHTLISIVGGYIAWTVVFLGGSAGIRAAFESAHTPDGGTSSAGLLVLYLALSGVASVLAGVVAARVSKSHGPRNVLIVAGLLLATGIPVQISVWETLPVWYHLAFLGALVPLTWIGGRMVGSR
ncbi:MAG: hypothetical protein AAF170_08350, partial [Bacteroidota bacterium]